jgi:hypothetical protein
MHMSLGEFDVEGELLSKTETYMPVNSIIGLDVMLTAIE